MSAITVTCRRCGHLVPGLAEIDLYIVGIIVVLAVGMGLAGSWLASAASPPTSWGAQDVYSAANE